MAYGVVPVASAVSSIPHYLEGFGVGRALAPNDLDGFVEAISGLCPGASEVEGRVASSDGSGRELHVRPLSRRRAGNARAGGGVMVRARSVAAATRTAVGETRLDLAVPLPGSARPACRDDAEVLGLWRLAREVRAPRRPPPRPHDPAVGAGGLRRGLHQRRRGVLADAAHRYSMGVRQVRADPHSRRRAPSHSARPASLARGRIFPSARAFGAPDHSEPRAGRGPRPAQLQPFRSAFSGRVRALLLRTPPDDTRASLDVRMPARPDRGHRDGGRRQHRPS